MNMKHYILGSAAVFVTIFLMEFIFHAVIMESRYQTALHMFRPEEAAQNFFIWMILGYLILSFGFCYIFTIGYNGNGIVEGLRYGLLVGVTFAVSTNLINYSVMPYPGDWIVAWSIAYPLMFMIAGVVIAAIYGKKNGTAIA